MNSMFQVPQLLLSLRIAQIDISREDIFKLGEQLSWHTVVILFLGKSRVFKPLHLSVFVLCSTGCGPRVRCGGDCGQVGGGRSALSYAFLRGEKDGGRDALAPHFMAYAERERKKA